MTTTALKAIVGFLLLASPASLGLAAQTGALDVSALSFTEDGNAFGGEIIAEEEGSFEAVPETGSLDLRIDRGMVRVIGWDKPAYHVLAIQEPSSNNGTSDYETNVEIQVDDSEDRLDITATLDREGTYSVSASAGSLQMGESHRDTALVAYVPAGTSYEEIFACEGQAHNSAWDDAAETLPYVEQENETECLPAEDSPTMGGQISINANQQRSLNVTTGAQALTGETFTLVVEHSDIELSELDVDELNLETDHGDVAARDITADEAQVRTDHGDLLATGWDAETLALESDHGDVALNGTVSQAEVTTDHGDLLLKGDYDKATISTDHGDVLAAATIEQGSITTDHGDIALRLDPQASGELSLDTDHGDVLVQVPTGPALGYDVTAKTDHGEVAINLTDARTTSTAGEDEDDHDDGEIVHARTNGFENRPTQVTMTTTSDHGDILVTDDGEQYAQAHDDGSSEEEEDEETTQDQSTLPSTPVTLR